MIEMINESAKCVCLFNNLVGVSLKFSLPVKCVNWTLVWLLLSSLSRRKEFSSIGLEDLQLESKHTKMPYQYLICVNFQTTSWDAYGSRKNDVEIIEFSALLLNTDSGLVESVFHHFVRPVHFPELSEYCIRCTGFTQSFIDQQKTFADVYNKFLSWLRQHIVKRSLVFATPRNVQSPNGLNATFCSWSDWDLGHYLYRDCIRNEAQRYECMKAWIDIRRAFDHLFPSRFTFSNAIAWAGLHQNDKPSGLEDANNLAKLVMHLISRGLRFEVVTSCSY